MTAEPDPSTRAWIEEVAGPVVSIEPHPAAGRSRSIHLVTVERAGVRSELILRGDTGDGPMSRTGLTLVREAGYLRAYAAAGGPVPACYGVDPGGAAMLLECLPGTASMQFATHEERARVMRSYVETLAALHRIDGSSLDVPGQSSGFTRSPALVDLDIFLEAYGRLCSPHEEFEAVAAWLADSAPSLPDRVVAVHGDSGPGNFLHQGGRVTGLVDFEFAHVGEPEDDLAWLWFRAEILHGDPRVADYLRWYQEASGRPVDLDRVRWHRVLVLMRCVASNLFMEGVPSDVPRAGLTKTIPWLRAVVAQAGGPVLGPPADIAAFPTSL